MTDEERQQWVEQITKQIELDEKRLHGIKQLLDAGRETPTLRQQFKRLSGRVDMLIKLRRDIELRHFDYVPVRRGLL